MDLLHKSPVYNQIDIIYIFQIAKGAIVVVILWSLYLQLPVQSLPITTKLLSLNPVHGEMYLIQHYVIKLFLLYARSSFHWWVHLVLTHTIT